MSTSETNTTAIHRYDAMSPFAALAKELSEVFPNVDVEVIHLILATNRGHKEATVHEILALTEGPNPSQAIAEMRAMVRGNDAPPEYDVSPTHQKPILCLACRPTPMPQSEHDRPTLPCTIGRRPAKPLP